MLQVDGQVSPANGAGEEEEEERLTMTWLRALWHLKSAAMNRTCAHEPAKDTGGQVPNPQISLVVSQLLGRNM